MKYLLSIAALVFVAILTRPSRLDHHAAISDTVSKSSGVTNPFAMAMFNGYMQQMIEFNDNAIFTSTTYKGRTISVGAFTYVYTFKLPEKK